MRCCLINPPWFLRQGNIWKQIRSTLPPLGLLFLAAVLEEAGYEVDVADFQAASKSWEEIESFIRDAPYDLFGITATTPIANNGYRIGRMIKAHHPSSLLVFGGVHPSALPEEPLALGAADVVVRGEGEDSLLRLVRKEPWDTIPGLTFRDGEGIRHTHPDGIVHDLDALPQPAYHKVKLEQYRPAFGAYLRLPGINMAATRGCPGKCTFCNSAEVRLRKRSAENIFQEMRHLSTHYGMREISFYDDTFTVYPSNVMRLCDLLVEHGVDLTWSCFARVDCVTAEMLGKMRAAGCHQVMYGVESASDEILKNIRKPVARKKTEDAIAMTRAAGITVRCTFMLGNPGETVESMEETIAFAKFLDPDIALFNITTPYPGTAMFEWAKREGYLLTEEWDRYDLSIPVMELPTLSNEALLARYKGVHREYYLRPRFLLGKLVDPKMWRVAGRLLVDLPRLFRALAAD